MFTRAAVFTAAVASAAAFQPVLRAGVAPRVCAVSVPAMPLASLLSTHCSGSSKLGTAMPRRVQDGTKPSAGPRGMDSAGLGCRHVWDCVAACRTPDAARRDDSSNETVTWTHLGRSAGALQDQSRIAWLASETACRGMQDLTPHVCAGWVVRDGLDAVRGWSLCNARELTLAVCLCRAGRARRPRALCRLRARA